MADSLPPIEMDFTDDGAPVVIAGTARITDPSAIPQAIPAYADPKFAPGYAQLANHLAQGDRFQLILDPAAYKAAYLAQYAAEDPDEVPRQGVSRLHDYGIPDFAAIKAPRMEGGTLIFFAENSYMKIPYQASLQPGGQLVYTPVAMTG